ncbi:MAG: hypothetical protein PVI50_03755 [Gammaproteobacteria bacterium]|jgi:hypothetical protein
MKLLLPAFVVLTMTGCMHLPPEVAAELSAPDGQRPNHYALVNSASAADDPDSPAISP